jgi:hypothetical protein
MASFRLRFEMDNAAFSDGNHPAEVARILHDIAERVAPGCTDCGIIRDINGNTVGRWSMDPPETDDSED